MRIEKYQHETTNQYSINIKYTGDEPVGVSTFSFSSGTREVCFVGLTSTDIAELVYSLEEVYQEIVMQEELHLDKLQSGIMEAKQVQAEVDNEVHN